MLNGPSQVLSVLYTLEPQRKLLSDLRIVKNAGAKSLVLLIVEEVSWEVCRRLVESGLLPLRLWCRTLFDREQHTRVVDGCHDSILR